MKRQPQRRSFFAVLGVLGAVAIPTAARADATKADQDRAEVLFQDGKTLMADKRYVEACPKFQESQRIDPATGTLLALALCHEGQGRLASALREFKQALPAVQLDKRRDREALVTTRLKELAPRVAKVVVVVEAAAAADTTLAIVMDGEPIARAAWGTELPVDPGEHVIEATGRGKPWRASVVIAGERALRRVSVPRLESIEPSPAEVATAPASPEPSATGAPPTKIIGMVLVGVGVASIGVGSIFGVNAMQKSDEAKSLCEPSACTEPRAASINDEAKSAATVSTIAMVFGGAAIVGGGVLWLTSRRTAAVTAAPAIGPGHVGLTALGRF